MNVTTHRTRVFVRNHKDTKILVMIRNFGKALVSNNKVLLLPGGGVDDGESAEESMRREVIEELGLPLTAVHMLYQHNGTRPIEPPERNYWPHAITITNRFDFFVATIEGRCKPQVREPEKFDCFDWIEPSEIERYAKKHNADIGDGIITCAELLGKK